jgi:hypothetical protein
MKAYEVVAKEEGQIAIFEKKEDAIRLVEMSEKQDKKDGLFEEGYYSVREYPVEKVINYKKLSNFGG